MPILFVTRYFTPEVGATQTRIHEFARACHRRGHRVTVLASLPLDANVQFMTVISAPVAPSDKASEVTRVRARAARGERLR